MPQELIYPTIIMSLAFVFYTLGVFAERAKRVLLGWHLVSFWLGWGFDAYGTWLMEQMRIAGQEPGVIHSVTGASAFALMGLHALWATWVLWRGSEEAKTGFHRYSLMVWVLWLVPYLGGMIAGMVRGLAG